MKFFRMLILGITVLLVMPSVMAQIEIELGRQADNLADRLVTQTRDLAEQSYQTYSRGSRNSRAETEAMHQAQHLSASAVTFRRMVGDRRSRAELQDSTVILADLARRGDRYGRQRNLVADIQRTISDIQRQLNFGGGMGGGTGGGPIFGQPTRGSMRWSGTIDDTSRISIQDNRVEVSAISGTPYANGTYNFTSALPNRRSTVTVAKLRGRGTVYVVQQPSRNNDWTAVVEIRDSNRGADDYEIEVSWQ